MNILIDGYNLSLEKGTGVATYARNLSYNLHELGFSVDVLYGLRRAPALNPLLKEIAFFDPHHAGNPNILVKIIEELSHIINGPFGGRAHEVQLTGKVIYDTFKSRLPYFDRILICPHLFGRANRYFSRTRRFYNVYMKNKPNIAHFTYPLPIRLKHVKNVYTIHDLVPLRLPYTTLDVKNRYYKLIKKVLKLSDRIATVSDCSRKDIINLFDVKEDKVVNTYQSVEIPEKYLNKPESTVRNELKGAFDLNYKEYFLFYGAIEPKKNIGRIIESFLAANTNTPLVIVGKKAWKSEQELRLLFDENIVRYVLTNDQIKIQRKIYMFDYVSFPLLVTLIKGAKAVLFPSLYEGFGLPVLEAMVCDTPVLTSNTSSLPEVAGDAALLVNPYDTREMREGIEALDVNETLRNKLVELGRRNCKRFSPENYQKRLKELYAF